MAKCENPLLFMISFFFATITVYELLYRTIIPRKHSNYRNRFMINLTASDRLQCDPMFVPDFEAMSKSGYDISVDNSSVNFTVLMMTYNRLTSFRHAVAHYARMPSVDRIVCLWANQKVPPPTVQSFGTACPEKIVVKALPSANITLRFSPFREIRTDGVFNVDDDKLISQRNLEHAFQVWKKHPWGLVGSERRAHSDNSPRMTYLHGNNGYSIILTSAAFLHREYLRLFEDKCVSKIREDIDRNKNCEDIFMNFLVKEHCKCSGVLYKALGHIATPRNLSKETALYSRPNHYTYRTKCLQSYSTLFANSVTLAKSKCVY